MAKIGRAEIVGRIRALVQKLTRMGPLQAESECRDEWGCGHHQWTRYYDRATKLIQRAQQDDPAKARAYLLAILQSKLDGAKPSEAVRIVHEISLLQGLHAPQVIRDDRSLFERLGIDASELSAPPPG
jgi:hypothetical protein